jgi:hypothetical protein
LGRKILAIWRQRTLSIPDGDFAPNSKSI